VGLRRSNGRSIAYAHAASVERLEDARRGHLHRESARFVPSDRRLFLPSDLIRDRLQETGRCRADETEAGSLARPGDAVDLPVTVLGHTRISVDGHRPKQHGQALTLPIAVQRTKSLRSSRSREVSDSAVAKLVT
jgi:hypothetical protein